MIARRNFVAGILCAALTPAAARAQSPRMPRIGLLWIASDNPAQLVDPLREGLRARGYVDGRNVEIDQRFLVKGYEALAQAAADLVKVNPDVIVSYGGTAVKAAATATSIIPIVSVSADLLKLGLAASLARPGGTVTGMLTLTSSLAGKRLELLNEIVPALRRVATVLYPGSPNEIDALREYEAAARTLNIEVRTVEVHSRDDIERSVAGISTMGVQAVAVVGSTLLIANQKVLVSAIDRLRLPAIYGSSDYVANGGLLSYGTDLREVFRRAAILIDKILKGTKPGDLAIEQPTTLELVVNTRTARGLGIRIPKSLLARADRVIE